MASEHDHKNEQQFLTPEAAAKRVGVSRPTINRALQNHALKAHRDNRNRWKIAPDDLNAWADQRGTVQHVHERPVVTNRTEEQLEQIRLDLMEAREKLAAATARADAAEADRDRWQTMAEKLADQSRGWRWPWQK
jgi:excisionase family DNA binding protein